MSEYFLDLRGVACPMNFVKTRLYLDKMPSGQVLTVLLDEGEPVESVTSSITDEGHEVKSTSQAPEGHFQLLIRKS